MKIEEILEAVRVLQEANPHDEGIQNWVRYYFPELKESEDEQIRKELIQYFSTFTLETFAGLSPKKIIAWLEKQGEKKTIWHNEDEEPQRGSLILLIMQSGNPIVAKIIEPNHTFNHGERWAYIDDLLKKQGEQKHTDNVEPKFKVGDWVVSPNGVYWHIDAIRDGRYQVSSNSGYSADWSLFANIYHRFTIQDAKPGDVLVNQNGEMPFIFKECKNNHIYCYCGYTNRKDIFFDRFVDSEGEELHWLNLYHEQAYPATKEQCDTLMKAMDDAGYTFDFEKKELKKIEQKPAWTEDGERIILAISQLLKDCESENGWNCVYSNDREVFFADMENWLKSLKDRVGCEVNCTTKQQWKPSDEQMKQLGWIAKQNKDNMIGKELMSLYQDLKNKV